MLPAARKDDVRTQAVGDDLVLYDSRHGCFHTLNRTAALIWHHCDGRTTEAEMIDILRDKLHITVDESLIDLTLKQLNRAHLLLSPPVPARQPRLTRREMVLRFGALSAMILPAIFTLSACGSDTQSTGATAGTPQPNDPIFLKVKLPNNSVPVEFKLDASNNATTLALSTNYTLPNGVVAPLLLTVNRSEFAELQANETSPNVYSLVDTSTGKTLASNVNITQTPGPGPKNTTFTGSYIDPQSGSTFTFTSINDPVPVVIVIVGILAAVCLIIVESEILACKLSCQPGCTCISHVSFSIKGGCSADCAVSGCQTGAAGG